MDKYIQDIATIWNNGWGITLYSLIVIVISAILTGLIGLEREKHGYSAGLRTHMLVGVGSTLFTIVSKYAFGSGDPGRVAAQVVTGIGFIGAGTIIQNGINVKGLTTAATLWVVAAIGMCCGVGYISVAMIGALIGLIVLSVLKLLEDKNPRKKSYRLAYLVTKGEMTLSKAVAAMDEMNVIVKDIDISSAMHENTRCTKVVLTLRIKGMNTKAEVMDKLINILQPLAMEELT